MANRNEAKIKFTAETSEFSQNIKNANTDIRGLSAELRLNEAEFKNTGDAATYMETKQKLLEAELEANKQKQEALNGKLEAAQRIFGENSNEAKNWSQKLTQAKTEGERLQTQISDLNGKLEDNETSLEDAGAAAKDAGDGFSVLKGTLANLAADGIKEAGNTMKEFATDSSSAYAQFEAQTGTAAQSMDQYKQAIQDVYMDNFGDSLEDVAEKMGKVKEVTGEVDPSKLKEMTENAMTLEDPFDMDMSETLRGVNSLMTHFSMSADEAFDLMASGAQNGLNYSDELGDNVAEYSGKFAEAGYSAQDYFQLLKNGSQGGAYSLDKVNDSINEVTTKLADGTIEESIGSFSGKTQETFEAWKKGGATQKDVIDSIVNDIKNTKNEQEKMNLAALAFGTMAEDGGTKFVEALSSTGTAFDNTKGKMEDVKKIKYDDVQSSIAGLGRAIQMNVLQPIVDNVAPVIADVVQKATNAIPGIVGKMNELLPVFGAVAAVIGIITAAIGLQSAATAIKTAMEAANVTTLTGLIAAEWAHAAAAAAALAPYLLIAAAIVAVIAIVVLLVKNWDTVKNKMQEVASSVCEKWESIKSKIAEVWAGIKTGISTSINAIKTVITTVWNAIKAVTSTVWNAIKSVVITVFGGIKSGVTTAINVIKTVITTVWNAIKTVTSTVWNVIKTVITTPINAARTIVTTAVNGIKTAMNGFSSMKATVTGVFNGIKTAITHPIQTAKNTLSNLVSGIKRLFGGLHISLPHIKLPHFHISGGKAPWGIAGKGTAPKISIDWYKNGAVLKRATQFGTDATTGNKMVGGEAGYEAIAPIDVLQGYVETAVESVMGRSTLDYDVLADKIAKACASMNITMELDNRQIGRVMRV